MELLAFESHKRSWPLVRIFTSDEKRDKHKRLRTQICGPCKKKLREISRKRTVPEFTYFKIGCSLFLVKVLAKSALHAVAAAVLQRHVGSVISKGLGGDRDMYV